MRAVVFVVILCMVAAMSVGVFAGMAIQNIRDQPAMHNCEDLE